MDNSIYQHIKIHLFLIFFLFLHENIFLVSFERTQDYLLLRFAGQVGLEPGVFCCCTVSSAAAAVQAVLPMCYYGRYFC